ncbi:hypothetical protein [Streptacidiphilus cavernicola]|uniref:CopG family transcriptional regulator n=1 Tax=Streptacidiphilus cavernicola TaxID=3342716 RepID=A0ABV6W4X6_9ACTN
MSEQQPELQPQVAAEEERKVVVFAVRIDPTLREQIEGLRGITGQSVNDVGVEALNLWVTQTLEDEDVQQKAMAELDAEEERLKARRAAITSILGQATTPPPADTASEKGGSRGGRGRSPQPES